MKQTAVEWLIEDLFKKGIINSDSWVWNDNIDIKQIIEQAKKMEKEQIIEAYYYDPNCNEIKDDGEEYYKETYKQY